MKLNQSCILFGRFMKNNESEEMTWLFEIIYSDASMLCG